MRLAQVCSALFAAKKKCRVDNVDLRLCRALRLTLSLFHRAQLMDDNYEFGGVQVGVAKSEVKRRKMQSTTCQLACRCACSTS